MSAVLEPRSAHAALGRLRGFDSGAREIDDAPVRIEGRLPAWLRGTLLLNGPALWELPGGALRHWFDGYAMRHRIGFGAEGVPRYRSRFARSESYVRSLAAGRPVYGEFGSDNPAPLWQRLRAPRATDNPAVVMSRLGERWFALTETPHLAFFDPRTLEGEERLPLRTPAEPLHLMAAHGFTLADGAYLNVGVTLGPTATLSLLLLSPGERVPRTLARWKTKQAGYTHAFALAPGHAVVWECALRANALAFRFGKGSYKDNFRWQPEGGSQIHAVALDGSGTRRTWQVPPMMAFHATQAWAEDNGDLVLEVSIYDDARIFDDLLLESRRRGLPLRGLPRLVRYRLSAGKGEAEPEALDVPLELQQVHPARVGVARARVCWGAGMGPGGAFNDRTLRVDLDSGRVVTWQREGGAAVQLEPLFVPRPGGSDDDDGVLLVPTLADGDATSVIAVLDARSLDCAALLHAPQVVPFGFHAAFAD
jgi:carotenoid cleavage dioxygenase-like enzyme